MQKEKPKGTGSIWNVNSWHWEIKNYSDVVEGIIREKLTNHTFVKDGITFTFTGVQKFSGEAELNIRRGKQIICYEYMTIVNWSGESEDSECDGSFKVTDINESDLEFELVNVKLQNKGTIGNKARKIMKKAVKDELTVLFTNLNDEITSIESNKKKLEADQKRREETQILSDKVKAETSDLKDQLLLDQKEKERLIREQLDN